jgi:hypothetical protein
MGRGDAETRRRGEKERDTTLAVLFLAVSPRHHVAASLTGGV